MRTARYSAVLLCSALLALSVVSPALGGPSISSVAQTAKKALKVAKRADKKATKALNGYGYVATGHSRQERSAAPGTFADFDIDCPKGYVPVGHGLGNGATDPVAVLPTPTGFIGSTSNLGGSSTYSASLTAICAWGEYEGSLEVAARSKASQQRTLDALKAAARRDYVRATAAKSCSSGYTHAVMPDGSHKCLRAGQFCSRKRVWQRTYHRYGFHCKVNGHLDYY
jgi:hypothetical protein